MNAELATTGPSPGAAPPELAGLRLARSVNQMSPAVLLGLLAKAARPEVISFALGMPDLDLFPTREFSRAVDEVLDEEALALQYCLPFHPLKSHIRRLMEERTGRPCPEDRIFLTAGAQQGMQLLVQLLLDPGGAVVTEEVVYEGIHMAIRGWAPRVLTVPTSSREGVDVDAVEARMAARPRPAFLYLIPDGHNPLGAGLSVEKRRHLAGLAARYRVPIIEDDAYGHLHYGGDPHPPLWTFDQSWVFHLGSFSKILAPGLRLGWVVAPRALHSKLSGVKHGADLDTGNFLQRVTARYLDTGTFALHLEALRGEYKVRRDAMGEALAEAMPDGVSWTIPEAGMFIWLSLPAGIDTVQLLEEALEEDVAFSPGIAFAAGGSGGESRLRLCFANQPPARIHEGIRRLEKVLRRRCRAV